MTGPEHYREAERLIEGVNAGRLTEVVLPMAQVHATLALVAASVADRAIGPQELSGWHVFEVVEDGWGEGSA